MSQQQRDHVQAVYELWDIVLRHRWRFVLPAFLVATAVLGLCLVLPRKYRAEATFERRTDMVLTEITLKGAPRSFQNPRGSLVEEVAGQPAIDTLVQALLPQLQDSGLIQNDTDRHNLQRSLLRSVIVHWDIATPELDRVRVEYTGSNPQLARLVVNTLVENYIQTARAQMEKRLRQSATFFQQEVENSRGVIERLENQMLSYEIEHAELLPESPNNVQIRLTETEAALADAIVQRDAAAAQIKTLQQSLAETPDIAPTLVKMRNPKLDELERRQRDLQQQIFQAINVQRMTPQHPDLINLQQQLQELERLIAQTDEEVVTQKHLAENPKRAELELQLTQATSQHQALEQQVVALQERIGQLRAQSDQIFAVRSGYQKLTRQAQEAQRQLAFWEDNLRRVEMALAAENGNRGVQLAFIKPADLPRLPVSPNLAQAVMAAIGLGLLAGALNVYMACRSDESFATGEQLASACSLPLLGAVSELITQRQRRLRRLRAVVVYPAAALAMALVLLTVGAVLYLDLEKPQLMTRIKTMAGLLEESPAAAQPPQRLSLSAPSQAE